VIAQSITAKARAIQEAERARNELAMTQAEAAKKIAEAAELADAATPGVATAGKPAGADR